MPSLSGRKTLSAVVSSTRHRAASSWSSNLTVGIQSLIALYPRRDIGESSRLRIVGIHSRNSWLHKMAKSIIPRKRYGSDYASNPGPPLADSDTPLTHLMETMQRYSARTGNQDHGSEGCMSGERLPLSYHCSITPSSSAPKAYRIRTPPLRPQKPSCADRRESCCDI